MYAKVELLSGMEMWRIPIIVFLNYFRVNLILYGYNNSTKIFLYGGSMLTKYFLNLATKGSGDYTDKI